jgi:hypothetical protein
VGDLVVDTNRRQVLRRDRHVPLTMREYQVLEYLARNAGKVVTRAALWEHVWESDAVPDSNVVEVYVRYLRNKLGRDPDIMRTVRGGASCWRPRTAVPTPARAIRRRTAARSPWRARPDGAQPSPSRSRSPRRRPRATASPPAPSPVAATRLRIPHGGRRTAAVARVLLLREGHGRRRCGGKEMRGLAATVG